MKTKNFDCTSSYTQTLHVTGQGRSYRGATGVVVAPEQKHFFRAHLIETRSYEVGVLYLLDD